jgi:hypothetical protein
MGTQLPLPFFDHIANCEQTDARSDMNDQTLTKRRLKLVFVVIPV